MIFSKKFILKKQMSLQEFREKGCKCFVRLFQEEQLYNCLKKYVLNMGQLYKLILLLDVDIYFRRKPMRKLLTFSVWRIALFVFFALALSACTGGGADVPQPPVGGGVQLPNIEVPEVEMPAAPSLPDMPESLPDVSDMPDFSVEWGQVQTWASTVQENALQLKNDSGTIADLASQIQQIETDEEIIALAVQMADLALQIEQDAAQLGITADEINYRIDNSEQTTLELSEDIGEMADRIGEMADRILWTELQIGEMADRIVESEYLISDSTLALVDDIKETLLALDSSANGSNQTADEINDFTLNLPAGGSAASSDNSAEITVILQARQQASLAKFDAQSTLLSVQLLREEALRLKESETDEDLIATVDEIISFLEQAERYAVQQDMAVDDLLDLLEGQESLDGVSEKLDRVRETNERISWTQEQIDGLTQDLAVSDALVDDDGLVEEMGKTLATSKDATAGVNEANQEIASLVE